MSGRRVPACAAALCAAIAAAALLAPLPSALGHHGVSRYDMSTVLTVEGVVEDWGWQQPHTSLDLRVYMDPQAHVWRIEGAPPRWMEGQGFGPASLAKGETVIITYHPVRSPGGDWDGILMEVERENGDVLKVNRPARLGGP